VQHALHQRLLPTGNEPVARLQRRIGCDGSAVDEQAVDRDSLVRTGRLDLGSGRVLDGTGRPLGWPPGP
jgi:hypothetical protein